MLKKELNKADFGRNKNVGQALPDNRGRFLRPLWEKVGVARMRGRFLFNVINLSPLSRKGQEVRAFALIELLIVVLIIGILVAVALPQYQEAVEKSRATQALVLLKATYQAAKEYELANGNWPTSLDALSIGIPWTGNIKVTNAFYHRTVSNEHWSLVLTHSDSTPGVWIIRHNGKYAYAGFVIRRNPSADNTVPAGQILCVEGHAVNGFIHSFFENNQKGDYCQKIMGGTEINNGSANRSFTL